MSKKLTKEFKDKVQSKIEELEAMTSIEFVPVFAERSSEYRLCKIIYALLGFSVALMILLVREDFVHVPLKLLLAAGCLVGVAALVEWEDAFRRLLPPALKLIAVERKAHDCFLREEVFDTKNRTGILILVSEFERAVFVLADKGFNQKVSGTEWSQLGKTLAEDFSKRSPGETFLLALDELARRLSKDFPSIQGQTTHLSNSIREV
jgi:putative membrane protein